MRPIAAITGLAAALLLAGCGSPGAGGAPASSAGSAAATSESSSAGSSSAGSPSSESSSSRSSSSGSPSEEPAAGELDVELAKGSGIVENEGGWYVHGWNFDFAVTVTAPAASATGDRLDVVLTFPAPAMRVEKADGDGWECSDVEAGVSCTHAASATAGQPWPALTIKAVATATSRGESITAEASGPGRGTATIPLRLDTSG